MTGKAWFVGKDSGLGMRPVSWEGWLATAAFFIWIAAGLAVFTRGLPHENRFVAFAAWVLGAGLALWIMRRRTGAMGPP
jgi:hypothetical protein